MTPSTSSPPPVPIPAIVRPLSFPRPDTDTSDHYPPNLSPRADSNARDRNAGEATACPATDPGYDNASELLARADTNGRDRDAAQTIVGANPSDCCG